MSYRKSAAPSVPRLEDGELHETKKNWADSGQLPDDDQLAMNRFERDALAGRFTAREISELRVRLDRPHISQEIRHAVSKILDQAVPRDTFKELAEEIGEEKNKGALTDKQVNLFRKMIQVQFQEGNLKKEAYAALMHMIGIEVKQG